MECELRDNGLVTVLRFKGDLAFEDAAEFGNVLHRVIRENNGDLILDFSEVGHADPSVNSQVIAAKREAQVKKRTLVLACLSPTVKKTVNDGHVGNQVPIYPTAEEAIADLADRAHGGEERRVVANIQCGHDDCVFYTYAKTAFKVVPACEYAYPDEITNGPNCRCYRVNWKQFESVVPQSGVSFKLKADRSSPYKTRDEFISQERERFEPEPDNGEDSVDYTEEPESSFAPVEEEFESFEPVASPPEPDPESSEAPGSAPADPFADDNFPSAAESEMVIEEPPAHQKLVPVIPEPVPLETLHPEPAVQVTPPEKAEPLTPEELVTQFVEAWNSGKFDLEYECLSAKTRGLAEKEYFERRRVLKNNQFEKYERATHQSVASIDLTAVQGDRATVEITRLDRTPTGSKSYGQHYNLILEEGHWRIHTVTASEERRHANPAPPLSKDRKMRAGDFLGKSSPIREESNK